MELQDAANVLKKVKDRLGVTDFAVSFIDGTEIDRRLRGDERNRVQSISISPSATYLKSPDGVYVIGIDKSSLGYYTGSEFTGMLGTVIAFVKADRAGYVKSISDGVSDFMRKSVAVSEGLNDVMFTSRIKLEYSSKDQLMIEADMTRELFDYRMRVSRDYRKFLQREGFGKEFNEQWDTTHSKLINLIGSNVSHAFYATGNEIYGQQLEEVCAGIAKVTCRDGEILSQFGKLREDLTIRNPPYRGNVSSSMENVMRTYWKITGK